MFRILNMELKDRIRKRIVDLGINQSELSKLVGVSKATITFWLNGTNKLKADNLLALAKALRCSARWLATGEGVPVPLPADGKINLDKPWLDLAEVNGAYSTAPAEDDEGPPNEDEYALITQYTAKGSSGNGYMNDHVEIKGGLAFKRDWLHRMGLKPDSLRVAYNHGESNWPTLSDGEVVLIDVLATEPVNGKMFAMLDPDGEMIFKRLMRDMVGGWLIRSDNPDKTRYPDMPISDEGMRGVDIIGRIVWRGGAM